MTTETSTTEELLTVPQAARELGIAPRTLSHRIQLGQVKADKHGEGRTSPYIVTRSELERVKREQAGQVA